MKAGARTAIRARGASAPIRLLGLALVAAWPAMAFAETIRLLPSADNTIQDASGATSNGAGQFLFAGSTSAGTRHRSLLRFDVAAAVAPGSAIEAATLALHCSRTSSGPVALSVHRLLESWGEGHSDAPGNEGSGAPATAGDATWTHRFFANTLWPDAGGSFATASSATAVVDGAGTTAVWTSAAMQADVQAWVDDPSSNFGWILMADDGEFSTSKRFNSRQNPDAQTQPSLTVVFSAPGPTGACCTADGSCSAAVEPGTTCDGAWQGTGTSCLPNNCPQPSAACCLPDAQATCVEATAAACEHQQGHFLGAGSTCAIAQCPVVLEPFVDALPIPAIASPVQGSAGSAATYRVSIREFATKLHRDLPATRVWGFGDATAGATFPGPTIEARSDQPVTVQWVNDLRDGNGELRQHHLLPVDSCVHGAHEADARTVIHLHGGHVPAASDGYPEATLVPGEEAQYTYPNAQQAATLWYHDHALGITRLNVYLGLAGFYLVRDSVEDALGLPAGEFDLPLAIQDRSFRPDGSLVYPAAWQEHFFGDTLLANGKVQPRLDVKRGKYRLRLLDGSTSRTYTLRLSSGRTLVQIASDGGLLRHPVELDEITLAPGERADVIVDFGDEAPGSEVILANTAPAPFPNGDVPEGSLAAVMKFVVLDADGHRAPLPDALREIPVADEGEAVLHRDMVLRSSPSDCGGAVWLVNGLGWEDVVEFPRLGTSEVWRFVNRSSQMHPMHLHLGSFRVLDRQAFAMSGDDIVPSGSIAGPAPGEDGWKDTVQVGPAQIVRVLMRFEDYKGRFPYHCHLLEHEDHGMMRQFQTVACGDGEIDPGEQCDSGALAPDRSDCCRADCTAVPDCTPTTTSSTNTTTTTTTFASTTTTTLDDPDPLCGDASGDDELTSFDALLALRTAVGTGACPDCTCDVVPRAGIYASDALAILRAAVGQPVQLHCSDCPE